MPHFGTAQAPEEPDLRPLEQEIEADVAGVYFTIESIIDRGLHPGAGMMGIEMFLQSVMLAEAVGAIRMDDTHQAAAERLSLIRYAIHQKYGEGAAKITQAADELGELTSIRQDLDAKAWLTCGNAS